MLLSGANPIFAALVIGTILVAIIMFGRGRGQRAKMILGGLGIAAAIVGLALLAEAFV